MSVQKASIAFAGLAPLPPAGTHCSRRRRPKLLPEAVQSLGEKAGAYTNAIKKEIQRNLLQEYKPLWQHAIEKMDASSVSK